GEGVGEGGRGGARYVGGGVGGGWARHFMKGAAERSAGWFAQVNPDEPVSWRAFELASALSAPRLLDAKVEDRAGKVEFLNFTNMVAQGEELCAVARLEGKLPEAGAGRGMLDGKPVGRIVPVKEVAGGRRGRPGRWGER